MKNIEDKIYNYDLEICGVKTIRISGSKFFTDFRIECFLSVNIVPKRIVYKVLESRMNFTSLIEIQNL